MTMITMAIIGVLAARGAAVARFWLRLHWQARQENVRQRSLLALSATMPRFSQIEETRPDGSSVRVTIAGVHHGPQG